MVNVMVNIDTSHEIGVLVACACVEMGLILHFLKPSDSALTYTFKTVLNPSPKQTHAG